MDVTRGVKRRISLTGSQKVAGRVPSSAPITLGNLRKSEPFLFFNCSPLKHKL